jgi:hypothetical protein
VKSASTALGIAAQPRPLQCPWPVQLPLETAEAAANLHWHSLPGPSPIRCRGYDHRMAQSAAPRGGLPAHWHRAGSWGDISIDHEPGLPRACLGLGHAASVCMALAVAP